MTLQSVQEAFSRQSSFFDALEEKNEILKWMRHVVYNHCLIHFNPGDSILELNCGTGIDAVFFARHGMKVHAIDISEGMLNELRKKVELNNLNERISFQQCSMTELDTAICLPAGRKFDHIFSNFGGLNCVQNIEKVISSFHAFLKPAGTITLVIMPPVCPWEILLALKGNFKIAFRRFKKNGVDSNVEGIHFNTYYFSPSKVVHTFGNGYKKIRLKGLGCFVPPPYLENFPKQFPKFFRLLKRLDVMTTNRFPFNCWADHFILTMQLN